MERQENHLIDILKIIGAIFVVCIHVSLLSDLCDRLYSFMNGFLWSMAVPFFFTVSGYYYKPRIESWHGIKYPKQIIKLIFPMVFYSTIVALIIEGVHFHTFKSLIVGFILPLSSPGAAMWYLKVTIICMIILACTGERRYYSIICVFVFSILFIWGVLISSYAGLFSQIPFGKKLVDHWYSINSSTRNFLHAGLFFFAGNGIQRSGIPTWLKGKKSILVFIGTVIFECVEMLIIANSPALDGVEFSFYLISPLMMVALLCLCLQYDYKTDRSTKWERELSTGIYYCHMTCIALYDKFLYKYLSGGGYSVQISDCALWSNCIVLFNSWDEKVNA